MKTRRQRIMLGAAAIGVVLAFGLTMVQAQGVPGVDVNKCLSGKTKCVNKLIAGLLKCREKCQKKPASCAVKQTECEGKVRAKFDGGTGGEAKSCFGRLEAKEKPDKPATLCTTKDDLAEMEAGTHTAAAGIVGMLEGGRFVDNGNGTVTDRQTGLQWEKKTDDGSIHDRDNPYSWSAGGMAPDGTAFTNFLATLNGGTTGVGDCESSNGITITGGFAGHCDWRLPTVAELQTILLEPYPCGTSPCIDPIFEEPKVLGYWSSTTVADYPSNAWWVSFGNGRVHFTSKTHSFAVRAVRRR